MNKLIIIFILFFGVINFSYSQEISPDLIRLSNIVNRDSMASRIMNAITSKIISNAQKQIQGAGAKEKFDTYSKFIKNESAEISKSIVNIETPKIYSVHFTAEEIKDLIVFYESPTGKKLLFETPEITKEMMTTIYRTYIPDFQEKIKKELQRLDSKIWREAYRVKPEQVTVYEGKFSQSKKLLRIVNDTIKQETSVTYAIPIYDNKWWIRFDKRTEIIDEVTNEHYQALRLDNNLVLNKTMIVSDQKNKMIEVTIVFPLLKKSVTSIAITEKVSDDADLMSNNTAGIGSEALNYIKLKDFIVE